MSDDELKKWGGRAKPGMRLFDGPEDVRNAFIRAKGIDWTASYIDPATWIPESRTLVSYTGYGFDQIMAGASKLCAHLGITLREGGERIKIREAQERQERETIRSSRPFARREAAE